MPEELIEGILQKIKGILKDKISIPQPIESQEWTHLLRILDRGPLNETESKFLTAVVVLTLFAPEECRESVIEPILKYPNAGVLKGRTVKKLGAYYRKEGSDDPIRICFQRGFLAEFKPFEGQEREFDQETAESWLKELPL